jgi:branched-chain amino acid transport system ATP-binding protein
MCSVSTWDADRAPPHADVPAAVDATAHGGGPDRRLELADVHCAYGEARVLHGVSLSVAPGEVVCLLGRNGAGKTTTLRAVMGLLRPSSGSIRLDGRELTALRPHEIPGLGVAYVPQGRRLFPSLTVEENLRMGLLAAPSADPSLLARVLERFPVLRDRLRQRAGTLSGGEQQMAATARALCAGPRYLLMDEPTEGLMPAMVRMLPEVLRDLRAARIGVLLVEQRVDLALEVADRAAVMAHGRIAHVGTAGALRERPDLLVRYLGVARM